MSTPAVTPKVSPEEFAQSVKAKYPVYAKIPDAELASKIITKYPQYRDKVDWSAAPPSSSKGTTASSGRGQESKAGKFMSAAQPKMAAAAPAVLGTIGGLVGSLTAGPAGAIAGASFGGSVGEAGRQKQMGEKPSFGKQLGEGAIQGGMEAAGVGMGAALEKIGAKALPRAYKALNNFIGLGKTNLPKMGRTAEGAEDVAKTVIREAGVKKTLPEQKAAIEAAREAHDSATMKLMQSPGGKLTSMHSIVYDRAVKLLREVEKEGVPQEQINAIDKNLEGIIAPHKDAMNPAEMHQLRRDIQKQITDWNPNTVNIRQRFLQGVYHDLNHAIEQALPPGSASAFKQHNRIQSRLIIAREAAKAKELKEATEATPGIATKAARVVGKMAVGSAVGATAGSMYGGHTGEGAVTGAILGSVGEATRGMNLPHMDVAAQKAIAKAAPKIAKLARNSPQAARALQAIQAIQSQPQSK